jgi:hypothetical protein
MTAFKGLEKAQLWTCKLFGLEGNIFRKIRPKCKKIIEDYGGQELKGNYYEFKNKDGLDCAVIFIKFEDGWTVWHVDIESQMSRLL